MSSQSWEEGLGQRRPTAQSRRQDVARRWEGGRGAHKNGDQFSDLVAE